MISDPQAVSYRQDHPPEKRRLNRHDIEPVMVLDSARDFMVDESWSQFVAYGSRFADLKNPQSMITVGNGGVGTEIQNILFTSQSSLPGLVLVQWIIKAERPRSVGMWDE